MNRTEKLNQYCVGRKKGWVAEQKLNVPPQMMTYLTKVDLDDLIARIDALQIDDQRVPARRKVA